MLIREDVGTELVIATRLLAHAGALGPNDRLSVLAGEVIYVGGRAASNRVITAYDVATVWAVDGYVLRGEPPASVERHLAAYRAARAVRSVATTAGTVVTGGSLRATAVAVLRRARPDLHDVSDGELWDSAEAEAKTGGAFVGM